MLLRILFYIVFCRINIEKLSSPYFVAYVLFGGIQSLHRDLLVHEQHQVFIVDRGTVMFSICNAVRVSPFQKKSMQIYKKKQRNGIVFQYQLLHHRAETIASWVHASLYSSFFLRLIHVIEIWFYYPRQLKMKTRKKFH